MENLYPLKFDSILHERVWGGDKLVKLYNKDYGKGNPLGESWEISTVPNNISYVTNGFLKGNSLLELIETYLGDIVGDKIYQKFGNEMPILVKLLNIELSLSLQVHPNDNYAKENEDSYGKAECWYILDSDPEAKIYLGFRESLSKEQIIRSIADGSIVDKMNIIHPKKGDFVYISPGTPHSATGGITLIEIQQTSDLTYRFYDWNRSSDKGVKRELHIEKSLDVLNLEKLPLNEKCYKSGVESMSDAIILIDNSLFKVVKLNISGKLKLDSTEFDSFLIYSCIEGETIITGNAISEVLTPGESLLVPASLGEFVIEKLSEECQLLQITGKY